MSHEWHFETRDEWAAELVEEGMTANKMRGLLREMEEAIQWASFAKLAELHSLCANAHTSTHTHPHAPTRTHRHHRPPAPPTPTFAGTCTFLACRVEAAGSHTPCSEHAHALL